MADYTNMLIISTLIEIHALDTTLAICIRAIIPYFNVGITPVLQLGIIGYLTYIFIV